MAIKGSIHLFSHKPHWLLFIFFVLCCHAANAEGFKLIATQAGYVPELKTGGRAGFPLPGSSFQVGTYAYYLDDGAGAALGKVGFFDGTDLYYLESTRTNPLEGQYGLAGDEIYVIYKNYLVMDVSMGGTTRNGELFLFKFDETSVEFLDSISVAYVNRWKLDLMIEFEGFTKDPYDPGFPAFARAEDVDHDGNPEIKVIMASGFKFFPQFTLYFSIVEDRLRINFNPILYAKLFEEESRRVGFGEKTDAYYAYGVLSHKLTVDDVKKKIQSDNKGRFNSLNIFTAVDKWDAVFHDEDIHDHFVWKIFNVQER